MGIRKDPAFLNELRQSAGITLFQPGNENKDKNRPIYSMEASTLKCEVFADVDFGSKCFRTTCGMAPVAILTRPV